MNIGYCTTFDPYNKKSWSGTNYFVMRALEAYCGNIFPLGPVYTRYMLIGKIISKLSKYLLKKNFLYIHSTFISKKLAKILKKRIEQLDLDILFFCAGSELLAFLDSKLPILYLSDATFQSMIDYYQDFTNLLKISQKMGNIIEKNAIQKATKIIYPSEWVAQSSITYYKCDKNKICILPFGANLNSIPPREIIEKNRKKNQSTLKLLFIGVDWERKGGKIAFDTMLDLNEKGIDTELILIGCIPPKNISSTKLKLIGYLNKNISEDEMKIGDYYMESSFLLFPTRNECAGIVCCEASAYGLPVISTETGGVPSYVENGINGFLLSIDADYQAYSEIIQKIWLDKSKYYNLCLSARDKYENKLNWELWGQSVSTLIQLIPEYHEKLK
jgi:glycosyltransferase involved in cell wall biosynthesis